MSSILNQLINLVQFTPGRRIHALMSVRDEARSLGMTQLIARIDEAIEHDRGCRQLDCDWAARRRGIKYAPEVQVLDQKVDLQVTSVRDSAAIFTQGTWLGTEHERHAQTVLRRAFPGGVRLITGLPYVEQVAAVEGLLMRFDTELRVEVSFLGLEVHVDRLRELTVEYRAAVRKGPDGVLFSEVEAARTIGQTNLNQIVITIFSHFPEHDDIDQERARKRLLAPILHQDAEIRARIRARRAVTDVDPGTGLDEEPLPTDEIPTDEEPTTGMPTTGTPPTAETLPTAETPPTPADEDTQATG